VRMGGGVCMVAAGSRFLASRNKEVGKLEMRFLMVAGWRGGGEGGGGGGRGKTVSGVIEIGNFKGLEGMGFLFPFP